MKKNIIQVIVLNYNNSVDTINYVKDLQLQEEINFGVTVVDNCSTDNSFSEINAALKGISNIQILKSEFNGGYAYGNNFGIKHTIANDLADHILVSNNDIVLDDKQLLFKMYTRFLLLPPNKAFVSPLMEDENGISINAAKKIPSLLQEVFNSSLWISKITGPRSDYDICQSQDYMPVDCLPGSFFFGTTEIFEKIHFFDEKTFLYGEERILSYKVKSIGLQNYLLTQLSFYHKRSQTIDKSFNRTNQMKFRHQSKLYFWREYKKIGKIKTSLLKFYLKIIEKEIATSDFIFRR